MELGRLKQDEVICHLSPCRVLVVKVVQKMPYRRRQETTPLSPPLAQPASKKYLLVTYYGAIYMNFNFELAVTSGRRRW